MLIKLDDQQLGWMAADRARVLASGGGDVLAAAEAARNLAVLARKAGWHEQAVIDRTVGGGEPAAFAARARAWLRSGGCSSSPPPTPLPVPGIATGCAS